MPAFDHQQIEQRPALLFRCGVVKHGYLTRLDRLPPNICRLLARTRGRNRYSRLMTLTEIAHRMGLPWQKIAWIARQRSWENIPIGLTERFRKACGITPKNEKDVLRFLATTLASREPFAYIDRMTWRDIGDHKRFKRILLKRL